MSDLADFGLQDNEENPLIDIGRKIEKISIAAEREQAAKYSNDIRKIVKYLVEDLHVSNKTICDITGIHQNNFSQFLIRNLAKSRASNISLQLYRFLLQIDTSYVSENREIFALWNSIIDSRKILSEEDTLFYKRLIDYMDSSQKRINRSCASFNGIFQVYRCSIVSGRIVKTKLIIYPSDSADGLWLFDHEYKDSLGGIRKSSGTILTLMGNVYCIGKIASGFGLEILVFREPIDHPKITQALIMSIDTKNQPVCARAVIKYDPESCDEEDYGTFESDEIGSEVKAFREWIENPSSVDKALSLNLL